MLNETNGKFYRDETGQWWYAARGSYNRGRAYVGICEQCKEKFLSRNKQRFCSVACRGISIRGPKTDRKCPYCGNQILSKNKIYCSHRCAASARHKRGRITTPITAAATAELLNSKNPHYRRDESGQWWYTQKTKQVRTRAYIQECARCNGKYLACIFHRKISLYCSHRCASFAWNEANPGHFAGERAGRWKGGRLNLRGYILIWSPQHPSPHKVGGIYMFEHRLVMEKVLGRYLKPNEQVHHKNGVRDDNRPENLELWVKSQPSGMRIHEQQHCPTCTCFK